MRKLRSRTADTMKTMRARCQQRLGELERSIDLGQSGDIGELCEALALQRGRHIHLEAEPLPASLGGMWAATGTTDYIFYARDTTPPHQEHIILHEVAHMLCGHGALNHQIDALQRAWFPHLDPAIIRSALNRGNYDEHEEREAELLASLIEQRWQAKRRKPAEVEPSVDEPPQVGALRQQLDDFCDRLRGE